MAAEKNPNSGDKGPKLLPETASANTRKPKGKPRGKPFPKGVHPATQWLKGQSGNPSGKSKAQARAQIRMEAILHGDFTPEEETELRAAMKEHSLVMGPERVALNLIAKNSPQAADRIAGKVPLGVNVNLDSQAVAILDALRDILDPDAYRKALKAVATRLGGGEGGEGEVGAAPPGEDPPAS